MRTIQIRTGFVWPRTWITWILVFAVRIMTLRDTKIVKLESASAATRANETDSLTKSPMTEDTYEYSVFSRSLVECCTTYNILC